MSDYFFYDINKKMADLAKRQQLAEDAQSAPAKPAPSALRTQLNERDMGKHNNATTGFAALAKKTGGGEKGARIAGAQLAKMRAKGQVEESGKPDFLDLDKDGNRKEPMRSAARSAKKGLREVDATPQNVDDWTPPAKPNPKASAPRPPVVPKPGPKKPAMYPPQAIDEPVREADDSQDPAGPARQAADELSYKLRNPKFDAALKKIEDKYKNDSMIVRMNSQGGKQDPTRIAGILQDLALQYKKDLEVLVNYYQKYGGPTPAVQEGGVPMTPKQKKFAALAKPFDKISFADKIVGAKKEVDEMLGDVAADAMKKAVGSRGQSSYQRGQQQDDEFASDHFARARNQRRHDAEDEWARSKGRKPHADMDESWIDDEPTRRRSSSGGEIDTSKPGVTRHTAVKGNYSGARHDVGVDDEPSGAVGRRKVGAGMGKKIGAKINRGTSKLMTKEGDMPEDMIEPQDSGEYDREGEMAKDDIKTVVRHAQALEKILGDEDNLPEWVQAKLAKIEGMMTAVDDYMQNQKSGDMETEGKKQHFDKGYYDSMDAAKKDNPKSITKARKKPFEEESTNTRDSRAERAGRKVAKDIEYDEKKKDGIHGKRRGSEDSRAERAGKKVTKDIEYDEKKDKKKKEVDETTSSGSVATGGSAPKSGGGHNYGKGIYDSLNRQLENMISESMNINMSMNNDDHGGPKQSLTVTATDEDAVMLAGLLKMAGLGHGDDQIHNMTGDEHIHAMTGDDSDMDALHNIDHMHGEEPCADCGQTTCECYGMMENIATNPDGTPYVTDIDPDQHDAETARLSRHNQEMDEAYGDTDASENEPDWPTDEIGTDDAMMYSGGIDGPKSTGQTTEPVIYGQRDRMGHDGDHELRRMMEIAGLR